MRHTPLIRSVRGVNKIGIDRKSALRILVAGDRLSPLRCQILENSWDLQRF